ncbi:MAG: PWWP domain-containing protein, partial [Pseudomonadota bacterium]|nr:PWWP domain-containing protein [Pseudomonadota bacterium]
KSKGSSAKSAPKPPKSAAKQPKPPKEPMPPVPVARGTVLWAKMQGYPYWPAIVETEKVPNRQMRVAGWSFVRFFGTAQYAYVQL